MSRRIRSLENHERPTGSPSFVGDEGVCVADGVSSVADKVLSAKGGIAM